MKSRIKGRSRSPAPASAQLAQNAINRTFMRAHYRAHEVRSKNTPANAMEGGSWPSDVEPESGHPCIVRSDGNRTDSTKNHILRALRKLPLRRKK
jgi:hypothetical protein